VFAFDQWLFSAINSLAGRWPWLDGLARLWLNEYFVPTLMAVILAALWFEGQPAPKHRLNQHAVLAATLSTIVGNAVLKLCNWGYYRPRPFVTLPVHLLFYQPTDSSLPSNAAVIGFAIAFSVWLYNRAWGWILLIIAFLFGLSRILGGVHYPLDVSIGAAMGWFAAWLIYRQQAKVAWLLEKLLVIAAKLRVG
jgi:undecaprenyl-diphosphatase